MADYQKGNTVKFQGKFYDWEGNLTDPEIVKFIMYDRNYTKLEETILDAGNKVEVGVYELELVMDTLGYFVYEWYGEVGASPTLHRTGLNIVNV